MQKKLIVQDIKILMRVCFEKQHLVVIGIGCLDCLLRVMKTL
jgi:hypothetical protein